MADPNDLSLFLYMSHTKQIMKDDESLGTI
jgi:hypothetical protein